MNYYPYGEEKTSTADGRERFGSYFRDSTGQDYADQRYYSATTGRFWTPDPSGMSAVDIQNLISWNMYAYANPTFACAVKRRWSSVGGKSHPGTGSLHPVAIGAVVEVTKLLKPLV